MKRNKQLSKYGQRLVRGTEQRDEAELRKVRTILLDISAFARGLAQQIADENSEQDLFLYDQFNRRSRSYFSRLNTHVSRAYDVLAKGVSARSKEIYLFYRAEFAKALTGVKFAVKEKPLTEADLNVSFGGTANQSFTKHLRNQLRAGQHPATLIKTISQDHVKLIQREMMMAVSKGQGFGWTVERVLKQMYPKGIDEQIRKQMEYNVTRIARTSYMQAVNLDTTLFVDENGDAFFGSRRVADGRPCIACLAQDGMFYPPGDVLYDHPNGMCVLVPVPYPDEYLLDGTITGPINDVFDEPLAQKFYKMGADEQRKAFSNDLLYGLWKREKFDLNKAVVGEFGTPISYRQAVTNLDRMGGISEPRVKFQSGGARKSLLEVMDPADRLNPGITVGRRKPIGGIGAYGQDYIGLGDEFIGLKAVTNTKKSKIAALFGEGKDLEWYTFNQRARTLGIYTRKDINGRFYYAVSNMNAKKQWPKIVREKKVVEPKPTPVTPKPVTEFTGHRLDAQIAQLETETAELLDNVIELLFGKKFDPTDLKAPHIGARETKKYMTATTQDQLAAVWEVKDFETYAHILMNYSSSYYNKVATGVPIRLKRLKYMRELEKTAHVSQMSREEFFAIKAKYKLEISPKAQFPFEMRTAYHTVGRVLTVEELAVEKKFLIDRIVARSPHMRSKKYKSAYETLPERIRIALEKQPLRVLSELDAQGFNVQVRFGRYSRANYNPTGKMTKEFQSWNLEKGGRNRRMRLWEGNSDDVIYHELGHAIDDAIGGQFGQGFALTNYVPSSYNTPYFLSHTLDEIDDFQKVFKRAYADRASGVRYRRGKDGLHESGSFIHYYDGRLYRESAAKEWVGLEYLANNHSRFWLPHLTESYQFFMTDRELWRAFVRLMVE